MFKNPNMFFKIIALLFFILFFVKGMTILDPDFGWHYKFGEIVYENWQVPRMDIFSYSMPSYPYINHEWLTDVIIFKIYNLFGIFGLAIIFGLIAITSLLILIPKSQINYSLPVFILSATILYSFGGIRPQVVSWLFFALIIKCIFEEQFYLKLRFYLPLIFLLWVNLHGAFASGILLLSVFLIYRYFTKKISLQDSVIWIFSFLATLINPYFYHIWTEVFKTLSSSYLHQYIGEWQPITSYINLTTLFYMALSVTLIFISRKDLNKFPIILFIGIFLYSLTAVRHLPLLALFSLPLTTLSILHIYKLAKKDKLSLKRAVLIYKILIGVCIILLLIDITLNFFVNKKLSETESYPVGATKFLEKNVPPGNIYTDYSWGGYIIWKLDQKTFVDGRMAIWGNHNFRGESTNAFKEYLDLLYDDKKDFGQFSQKYYIQTVLWHTPEKSQNNFISNLTFVKYLKNLFKTKTNVSFEDKIEKAGFKKVYTDNISTIYVRK